jgi:2-iminobutanoate/2-iminopropanoate deaminase
MSDIERIRLPDRIAEPISHYTDAVRSGDFLWISGMLPTDESGTLIGPGDVVAQAEQVFRNIEAVLQHTGADFSRVVKVVVYLRRVEDRPAVNVVRQRYFGESRPASTLVEISRLAMEEAMIEVDAVAYLG